MTGGFGAVPDELFRTANAISDAVGSAAGMLWQGPSGDYGHPGVQTGWEQFIEDMKSEINTLRDQAEGHGESLKTAAMGYADSDSVAGQAIGAIEEQVGLPGGGIGGRIGRILGGETSDPGDTRIGDRLPGVPGGGFTGNLTPNLLHDRLGYADDVGGVMSPERSRELFPGTSGGDESKDVEY
ncbi:WXG100 family type VII secretion target [Kutzneria sp. CA-103260]|uniref:WXG100 family type VII secretion target n=1 Tax=Kutzneria sp. CA-103260 TaxID=2802641 RepID=UPI001BA57596|nr:hypothetical protein [Kutzneria sp. CA-103260]QUQ69358.1 hypothetical protein JJ691_71160 [Kutzneria sp. CA-103260]